MSKSLLLPLLLIAQSASAVEVPQNLCVKNQSPGYCAWACIETLGHLRGVRALDGLLERRKGDPDELVPISGEPDCFRVVPRNVGNEWVVRKKLDSLRVKYEYFADFDRGSLRRVGREGAVCIFHAGAFGDQAHAVVLTRYDDSVVEWVDTNDAAWIVREDRAWFDRWWTGEAIFINGDEK